MTDSLLANSARVLHQSQSQDSVSPRRITAHLKNKPVEDLTDLAFDENLQGYSITGISRKALGEKEPLTDLDLKDAANKEEILKVKAAVKEFFKGLEDSEQAEILKKLESGEEVVFKFRQPNRKEEVPRFEKSNYRFIQFFQDRFTRSVQAPGVCVCVRSANGEMVLDFKNKPKPAREVFDKNKKKEKTTTLPVGEPSKKEPLKKSTPPLPGPAPLSSPPSSDDKEEHPDASPSSPSVVSTPAEPPVLPVIPPPSPRPSSSPILPPPPPPLPSPRANVPKPTPPPLSPRSSPSPLPVHIPSPPLQPPSFAHPDPSSFIVLPPPAQMPNRPHLEDCLPSRNHGELIFVDHSNPTILRVPPRGDCLFYSIGIGIKMSGADCRGLPLGKPNWTIQDLRNQIADWMLIKYENDFDFKSFITNVNNEDKKEKIALLKKEIESLEETSKILSGQQKRDTEDQIQINKYCLTFLINRSDIEYINAVKNIGQFASFTELCCLAEIYNVSITTRYANRAMPDQNYNPGQDHTVTVLFNGRDHYDLILPDQAQK